MMRALAALWLGLALAVAGAAQAQTVHQYTNTTDSTANAISDILTPCSPASSRFTRTFTVATSYTVADVNIGVLMAHTYRSDLVMYLKAPNGTSVQIVNQVGANARNFNALLDDAGSSSVSNYTASDTVSSTTPVPAYAHTYQPSSSLTAFNGLAAAGTWTLEICDAVAADSGTFFQADLYVKEAPASYADISLAQSVSNASPVNGGTISYTLTASNAAGANLTASGITVRDLLPTGVTFSSYSGTGFNSATGVWTVGALAPGQSASLTINAVVTATTGTTVNNIAEVTAQSAVDLDSTPNNGATGEDDYAVGSFTVVGRAPGTPPTLSCSAGTSVLDWDTQSWAAGTLSGNLSVSGIGSVGVAISTPGALQNNATYGGQSPTRQNVMTGGLAVPQYSLLELVNQSNTTDAVTTTLTLPVAVSGAQFTIFDVDYAAGQFADKVTVTGSRNGTTVLPTLTNGISNYVTGNTAIGDSVSNDTQSFGNVVVTFASAIDKITISYNNDSATAPADPGQQGVAIHDITMCTPPSGLSVTKTSAIVSDPVNGTTDPKEIPGATVQYCILITNTGASAATSVVANDALASTKLTYVAGSMKSGTSCAGATTAEDDDNTGADESDPFGASVSGTTITATASSLAASASMALTFNATIN